MPTIVLSAALLLLGLPAPPVEGTVVAEALDAFVADDPSAIIAEQFRRGERVRVLDPPAKTGWLAVAPAASAFAWIERDAVREDGPVRARVVAPRARTRVGITGARLAGPPGPVLKQGAEVRLLSRPALRLPGPSGTTIVWLAIAPPEASVRYVLADGVQVARPDSSTGETPREIRAGFQEEAPDGTDALPPGLAADVARVEAEHKAAISGPVDTWRLEPVKGRLQFLLEKATTPAARRAIQARILVVERHDAIARSARSFRAVLESSRRRDQRAAGAARALAAVDLPEQEPYAIQGLLQPSSRQVEGRRVFALIGSQGAPIAYLDVPAGLDVRPMLAKQVGVHGATRYSETLRARLITVRDVEPLE